MNLSKIFIERPVMTTLIMGTLLFFGLIAYRGMPVSDLPNVDFPTIEVSVSYPGANPETMANSVATPLEQNFMTIDGIQTIFSSSNTGSTDIVLQFSLNKDINAAATDVQSQISRALPQLPSNLPYNPTYQKVNPTATPILYLALTCPTMTMGKLYDYANTFIGDRLSMIEGVSQVSAFGSPYAVRVQVDPEKLAAKNIGIEQVTATLQQGNVDLPTGTLFGKKDDFTIDVDGQIFEASGYGDLVLKNEDGTILKIKEIGRALDSLQDDKYSIEYITKESRQPSVILAVQRQVGANSVEIITQVNKTLETLKPQLPQGLSITRVYDQSEIILEGLVDLKLTLSIAFFLVVLIIYFSLGKPKFALIAVVALPLSILGAMPILRLLGFSLDILSMLAITLSIGFLVDYAIVVLENTARHMEQGKSAKEAALDAAKEISITVLSITLSLIAAFIPLIFMSGVIGRLFREFAVTITVTVLISGFISLTLTPMLASRWIKLSKANALERFAESLNARLHAIYEPCLYWSLKNPLKMAAAGFGCVIVSLALFVFLPKDFLPPDDVGFIQGYSLSRDGTSPFLMQKYHDKINDIVRQDDAITSIVSIASYNNPNEGLLFYHLKPFHERMGMYRLIEKFSKELSHIPGVNVYLSPLPLINLSVGTTAQALYQYTLTSLEDQQLYSYASRLETKMREDPRFAAVSSDLRIHQPQWSFSIKRDRASDLNVTANQIENVFNYAYSTNKISTINAAISQYDVIIETLPEFFKDPSVLSRLYVRSSSDKLVPLAEILEPKETAGPLTVNHLNGQRSVTLSFNTASGAPLSEALDQIKELTKDAPPSIYGQVQGTADIFSASFKSLAFLIPLALFVIYVILGILYENFIHPLTVMSTLPPALLGGLLVLAIFNEPLSIYSFVGLILLIGIVLKNGILLIDFANERAAEIGAEKAIIEACRIRFRPILMTSLAALMGAVPIALGIGGAMAQNHIGLGLAIVGGLILSQTLTLLLTPVLYLFFEKLRNLPIKQ